MWNFDDIFGLLHRNTLLTVDTIVCVHLGLKFIFSHLTGKRRDIFIGHIWLRMYPQNYCFWIYVAPWFLFAERLEYVGLRCCYHRVSLNVCQCIL
jgi:hypothetical protein